MPSYSRHDLADLSAFAAICRRGSFRLAATELGVSTSALSHALRNLEDRLGVKLLNRTTRSVAPTEAGSRLAAQLDQSFGEIGEALSELDRYRSAPLGGLRINVPRDASRLLLSPVLARYLEDCPGVKIEVVVDNNMVDIVKAGFDAGIRFGDTVPQDMVCTPLTPPLRWVVVGAPAYLGRHGTPKTPEDLLRHACIRLRLGDQTLYRWELGQPPHAHAIDVPGALIVNETDMALDAALDGIGLAYCLERYAEPHLRAGRLRRVLDDWAPAGAPLVMYYPSRRQLAPALSRLIEAIRGANGLPGTIDG
ncbi:LysR family transcriptional regulator [Achromobacter deleyi]|uniref:LysR family transcriptional regulator n=1 Tax=Achromobacter deleyi TaxID=1353891 RepID=A0A7T4E333_9BURK|nr:LysR family transcriptional regulator [Achromobacter deleyi]QQB33709.1 LysR family transcriptional regulator [Achromobacter deleyi]